MTTVTLTTDIPANREVKLTLPSEVPTGPVQIVLTIEPVPSRPAKTLGDLLDSEYFGMWRDRTDITDSAAFARDLRERAWRRGR
jgi:hypothetical protein